MSTSFLPLAFVLAAACSAALAADPLPDKAPQCASCHGPEGRSTQPEVPSLAGQPAYYATLQLTLFRDKQRQSDPMAPIAANLSDADIQQLVAYFAKLPVTSPSAAPKEATALEGKRLADAHHCASCHLPDYSGQAQVPRLAGQRSDYLLKAMRDYRDGLRAGIDGTMTEVLHGMSDADLQSLAQYLAQPH